MPYPSPMPEYQPLFHQVQNFIADQLNSDPQLSSIGLEFLPESQLDIEYGIKRNLGRQGMVGIVNTLKGTYGGHDQDSCAWEIESEIDVVENPTVRRAWLKQNNLSAGTTVDVLNYIQESLCGPASPTYGKFCPVTQEVGEDNGVLVGKAVLKTFAISDVSACVSGESNWHIRYATEADISALWDAVYDVSAELSGSQLIWDAIAELSGDIDNLEYNFEWAKEQIQDVIPAELSTKISYPVMEQNPYGGNEWILDPSPLDPNVPTSARVKFGAYEESVPGLYTPYFQLGTSAFIIEDNHLKMGRTKLVNFPDLSAAISALDIDHFIRWFATPSQPNRWIVNFGRSSSGGISFVSDSDHPTQSYIDIAGNIITAPGYDPNFQSRGLMKARAGEEEDNHLQYNQKGLAFVEEVSTLTDWTTQQIDGLIDDIQEVSSNLTHSIVRRWEYVEYDGLTFTAGQANSTIAMQKVGDAPNVALEYSTGDGWSDFVVGETTVTLPNIGDQVVVRAKTSNTTFATDLSSYNQFVMTGEVLASDSIMYLLKSDGDLSAIPADYCFYHLFRDCSALTEAPELPALALDDSCYRGMFRNTSLTEMPELPATSLASFCYAYMFHSCSDLTQTMDELQVETLAESCYEGMFYHCTSLASTPALPSTTLAASCYCHMFDGCTSLTEAPELPATTLARACYLWMFLDCTSLTTAPDLPATTLAFDCYHGMFMRCTSLENPPSELPATTMAEYCYVLMFNQCPIETAPTIKAETLATECFKSMFWDCTQLNEIRIAYTGNFSGQDVPTDAFANWVNGVASTGTLYYDGEDTTRGINAIPTNWEVRGDTPMPLTFTAEEANSTVAMQAVGSAPSVSLEYSTDDGTTWSDFIVGTTTVTLANVGDKMFLRAKTTNSGMGSGFNLRNTFVMTGKIAASGSIMYLLKNDGDLDTIPSNNYCFVRLFRDCASLTTAPELPATTLATNCYSYMFQNCTSLTTAPNLLATTLADNCYSYMFNGCTSLSQAPALPVTTLAYSCYNNMFQGCTSLTTAPELPASTMTQYCYSSMFQNCTSLTTAPNLLATTLADRCYQSMFSGCTSLTTAPELPATTLTDLCYSGMFSGCTSLTTAPELPATTLTTQCYYQMFLNCSSLTEAPELPATTLTSSCYSSMFANCSSLTEAPELPATTLAYSCYNNMFQGCTSLANAPELPATTMTNYCYNGMFQGCTSLTTAPNLLATTLASNCYSGMFQGCTSLTQSPELPATTLASNCYRNMFKNCSSLNSIKIDYTGNFSGTEVPTNAFNGWVDGVASTGTLYYNGSDTTRGTSAIPDNWTVQTF